MTFDSMTKTQAYAVLAAVASLPEGEPKDILMEMVDSKITSIIAPAPEKKERRPRNKTEIIQFDAETGKEIARYATIKDANEALGKKPNSSCIGDACYSNTGYAYGFIWKHADQI